MLVQYKKKSNLFITIWLFAKLFGLLVAGAIGGGDFAMLVQLVGAVFLIIGCTFYAKGKGYSGWWGTLALLSIIGLIILVCMPDKFKDKGRESSAASK